jgi:hypothetical protein
VRNQTFRRKIMEAIKKLTLAAALIAGAMSFAAAQNGPTTGSEPPVAGGAGGGPGAMTNPPSKQGSMMAPGAQTPRNSDTPASNDSGKKQDK